MDIAQEIENLLQSLVAGLLTGSTYGLMCVGLTIIFGVMRVINFAQGEFMMLGMYFTYFCTTFILAQFAVSGIYLPFFIALFAGPMIYLLGNALTGDPTLRPGMDRNEANRGAGMQPAIRGEVNIDGQTALHAAAKMSWNKIVQYLIDHGAVQQVVDASNKTPFDLAMGRYEPAFLAVPPIPLLDTARLLQEAYEADDNCVMRDTIDFSNPTNLIQ